MLINYYAEHGMHVAAAVSDQTKCPLVPENLMLQGNHRFNNFAGIKIDIEYCIDRNDEAECASEAETMHFMQNYRLALATSFLSLDIKNQTQPLR